MADLSATRTDADQPCEPDAPTKNESASGLARVRAVLASPWVGAVLVLAMVGALRLVAPWSEWADYLASANPVWLGAAALVVLAHAGFRVLRFERFLPVLSRHRGPHLRLTYSMTCVGQLPVGTVGGDAFRVVKFTCFGIDAEHATAATAVLRIAGFCVTLGLAGILGAVFLRSLWPLLALAASLGVLSLLARSATPPAFIQRLCLDPGSETPDGASWWTRATSTLRRVLSRTLDQARTLSRRDLALVVLLTVGMVSLKGTMLMLCAWAVGLDGTGMGDIGPLGAMFAVVAGNLMCVIPSPAGSVGLREGGIVGAFAVLGAAATPATVASVLLRLVMIAGALLGWGLLSVLSQSPEEVLAASKGQTPV